MEYTITYTSTSVRDALEFCDHRKREKNMKMENDWLLLMMETSKIVVEENAPCAKQTKAIVIMKKLKNKLKKLN